MTVADDLRQAAIDVFDALTGVPITATYIERNNPAGYIAGGNLTPVEVPHTIRLIREEKSELAMAFGDVKTTDEKYLMITSELPVPVDTKDQIEISGKRKEILPAENDPVDAVTTLTVRGI